jgi:7-cyano-7-deazaguanine synthase
MKTRSRRPSSRKAVVLLSGGLDSATVLYYALRKGYDCHCLLFDYGQRHSRELKAARAVAAKAGCPFTVMKIRLPWGGSSLLDKRGAVAPSAYLRGAAQLPATYVPGRNTIFLSFALSLAETIGAQTLFIGANAVDFSGYPDCRPVYYDAWQKLIKALGLKIAVSAPLLHLTKGGIVRLGTKLGVPYELTWSCYNGKGKPCGVCDSCHFRAKGFREAGLADPALSR